MQSTSIHWLSYFLYYCLLVLLSALHLLFVVASQCKSVYLSFLNLICITLTFVYALPLQCYPSFPSSLCEPCCVLIVCKKKAKRYGLCYHFGPCRCAYVLKPLLDDIDTSDESNSFRHFVCTCCKKDDPDDELNIPCGDSDVKCDTQRAESERNPLVTTESKDLVLFAYCLIVLYINIWFSGVPYTLAKLAICYCILKFGC